MIKHLTHCTHRQAVRVLQFEQVKGWLLVEAMEKEIAECEEKLAEIPEVRSL